MRKLILLIGFFLLISSVSAFNSSVSALTKTGDDRCYYCPTLSEYQYIATYDEGDLLPFDPACSYSTGGGFPLEEPATPDRVCNDSTERCDNLLGCTSIETDAQCNPPPQGSCNQEDNSFCRPENTCTNNYCIVNVNNTDYQWTPAWPGAGQLGICKNLSTPPQIADPENPPEEGVEPPKPECIPDDPKTKNVVEGNAQEKCFSAVCNEDGTCDTSLIAFVCEQETEKVTVAPGATFDVGTNKFTCRTAIGSFSADAGTFAQSILRLLLGLAGGILLILIIINGYKLMTSQGDPEKIKDAREGIIAAIAGILLIIFSLSILQLIVVDIIGIPGFS